jgi:predicted ester cyclase
MSHLEKNKTLVINMLNVVWQDRNLNALDQFWATNCVNHAMQGAPNKGLEALRQYHEAFAAQLTAMSDVTIKIMMQIAENDRVLTYMTTTMVHTKTFMGFAPTNKTLTLNSMRIDRFDDGKIIEHWSIADMHGLMTQLPA